MESDAIYFRRRAEEEYLAANYAGSSAAFRAHREMAARLADFADAIEAGERSWGTADNVSEIAFEDDRETFVIASHVGADVQVESFDALAVLDSECGVDRIAN